LRVEEFFFHTDNLNEFHVADQNSFYKILISHKTNIPGKRRVFL